MSHTSLRATAADYRLQCRAKKLDPQTLRWYDQKLATIIDAIEAEGVTYAEDLTVPIMNAAFASLDTGTRSKMTLKGYHQVAMGWLTYLVDEELVGPRIRKRLKESKPQVPQRLIKTLTAEQVERLAAAAKHEMAKWMVYRDRAMLGMLVETGIRAQELCDLTRSNVDIEADPHVRVIGKRDKEREVGPLTYETCREIGRYLRSQPRGDRDLLFVNRYHQALTPSGLDQMLYRLRDWAGMGDEDIEVRAHVFRHTFAVNCLRSGMDIKRLSLLMGHSNVTTTEVYLRDFQQREARRR